MAITARMPAHNVKWSNMAVFMLHVLIECSGAWVIYPYEQIANRTLHRI